VVGYLCEKEVTEEEGCYSDVRDVDDHIDVLGEDGRNRLIG